MRFLIHAERRYHVKIPRLCSGCRSKRTGYLTLVFIPSRRRLPLRGRSILRLRRAPSSRGYSAGMQKRNLREKLVKSKIREYHFPRIVISSEARNLPCTPVKRWLWDNDETKNDFCASSSMQDAAITLRSLDSARDDDTEGRAISHPLSSRCGANLRPFGAPPSRGRREILT